MYEPWIAISAKEARGFKGSSPQFKMLCLMHPGGSPERRVFKEPSVRPNQFAILIHRDSINAVRITIHPNRLGEYVMRCVESRHSEVFFPHLTKEQVSRVADTHGAAPYFAIQQLTWY